MKVNGTAVMMVRMAMTQVINFGANYTAAALKLLFHRDVFVQQNQSTLVHCIDHLYAPLVSVA